MFDPIKVTADIKELFARFEAWEKGIVTPLEVRVTELEKRLMELEGGGTMAGIGATEAQGVTIPAEEIGTYSGEPNTTDPKPETAAQDAPQEGA